jgi:hypothetical protein
MTRIEAHVDAIRDDRRADYLFNTKVAAEAVGCHPNKFADWWFRSRAKLIDLFVAQPGETAAELAALIAMAAAERERRAARERAGVSSRR